MPERPIIAVTGATGFLGSHITRVLLERDFAVRGVVRTPSKGEWLCELGAEMAQGDLGDTDSLIRSFEGADAVVANAALSTRRRASWAEFEAANRAGAEAVARATAAAGVPRLIHISTVAVYQPRICATNGEDTPLRVDTSWPAWNDLVTKRHYARSKALGEAIMWELARELGLQLTVLRPGPVYGSRDVKLTDRYAAAMRRRFVFAPTFSIPHVHALDVGAAVAGALDNDASVGQAYNVTGGKVTPFEVLKTWSALAGGGPMVVPLWVPLWIDYDDTAARRDLGFECRGIEAGIREVLAEHPL